MPKAVAFFLAFIFGGVGLTVLIFLWGAPRHEFGSPPFVFRVFGSFIALGFVGFAVGAIATALRGRAMLRNLGNPMQGPSGLTEGPGANPASPAIPPGYGCPRCSAPLRQDAEVSPLGDVKCPHCGNWFNIHGRTAPR